MVYLSILCCTPEYRYHFNEKYNGFYAGSILEDLFIKYLGIHRQLDQYEKAGYVIGQQLVIKRISNKFMLELFRWRKPTRILQRLPT
jgi:hypothetical protein